MEVTASKIFAGSAIWQANWQISHTIIIFFVSSVVKIPRVKSSDIIIIT